MHIVKQLIETALAEDIGSGDITTDNLVPRGKAGTAEIIAKQALILAGLDVAVQVFTTLDPDLEISTHCADGDSLTQGPAY